METVANDLKDRVAVITGGARGMGRAYARAFLSAGAKVVGTNRWGSGFAFLREYLKGKKESFFVADMVVREDAKIDQFFQAFLDSFKRVDFLLNTAALLSRILPPP